LERLRPGDVIVLPSGRRTLAAVVIDNPAPRGTEGPRPQILTADRQVKRLSAIEVTGAVEPITRLSVPKNFQSRNAAARKALAAALREKVPNDARPGRARRGANANEDEEILDLRSRLRRHPCHGCDDRETHARWAERYWRLHRENQALERRISGRTNTIARTFDRVCAVLDQGGYLDGDTMTPAGTRLSRLYSELDLLVAECLRVDAWKGLTAAELCGTVSALVYEARRPDDAMAPTLPGGATSEALARTVRIWAKLEALEQDHGLSFLREPDLGLAWASHQWASGRRLEAVLQESDLTAGDFVRWMRQLIDLLGQIAKAGDAEISATAQKAIELCRRGIIAHTGL